MLLLFLPANSYELVFYKKNISGHRFHIVFLHFVNVLFNFYFSIKPIYAVGYIITKKYRKNNKQGKLKSK